MAALNPSVYRALAIKHGIKLWLKAGIKPNRAWTPTAMAMAASQITGEVYKGRRRADLEQAVMDLDRWLNENGRREAIEQAAVADYVAEGLGEKE